MWIHKPTPNGSICAILGHNFTCQRIKMKINISVCVDMPVKKTHHQSAKIMTQHWSIDGTTTVWKGKMHPRETLGVLKFAALQRNMTGRLMEPNSCQNNIVSLRDHDWDCGATTHRQIRWHNQPSEGEIP